MKKKMIGIIIIGFVLLTSFSPICASAKTKFFTESLHRMDIAYNEKVESKSGVYGLAIAFGEFYIKNGIVYGNISFGVMIIFIPLMIPIFLPKGAIVHFTLGDYIIFLRTNHIMIWVDFPLIFIFSKHINESRRY